MLTQKEKLKDELNLLKESLELAVITKDEYETAKARIEEKLNTLEQEPEVKEPKIKSKEEIEEEPVTKPEEENPEIEEEGSIVKDIEKEDSKVKEKEESVEKIKHEASKEEVPREDNEEGPKEIEIKEVAREGQKTLEEIEKEKIEEAKPQEEKSTEKTEEHPVKSKSIDEAEKAVEEIKEEKPVEEKLEPVPKPEGEQPESFAGEEKKSFIKTIVYSSIAIVSILIIYFFFFAGSPEVPADEGIHFTPISLIACSSDKDCIEQGSIGICNNPGEENAECKYIQDANIELTVLNNNCFNCDNKRVLSILNNFFPNIDAEKINFETPEGKEIAEKFGIQVLPAYILDSNFKEAYNYNKLANAFNEIDENFIMKNTVANANYYIDREETPNKLDLFVKQGQSASSKAEENLKEFLEAFNGKVDFEKHTADSEIVKELGINTFPAFLVNNKIKFSGVQAADKIKENFCQINELNECALRLVKSLV
jgi:hypothetical protein